MNRPFQPGYWSAPSLLCVADGVCDVDQQRTRLRQRKPAENTASKPNASTQDQVANMESEGQAQQPGQEPPADIREELAKAPRKGTRT